MESTDPLAAIRWLNFIISFNNACAFSLPETIFESVFGNVIARGELFSGMYYYGAFIMSFCANSGRLTFTLLRKDLDFW